MAETSEPPDKTADAELSGPTQAGFVAILGAPNVGKSTLLNQAVGSKISIVTPKVQTTRSRIRGIRVLGRAQLIFVDTPGIFTAKRRFERAMVHAAWRGADDADAIMLLVDAGRGIDRDTRAIIAGLVAARRQVIAVINKIDTVPRAQLLPLAARLNETGIVTETFMISALNGDGVDDLLRYLAAALPRGPWLYPADQLSDISERLLAAEITREQLFLQLRQELPYALAVETEQWREQKDGSARIEQVIYVLRATHKQIVIGKGGARIKAVGAAARAELEALLGRPVHLFLFVKVRGNWIDDPERYRDIGLDYPS